MTLIDYSVVMSKRAATPVRFDPPVADRLGSFVAANPGMSLSSAANRLVDEALRATEHPGVIFRPGPTGRRAALSGGPDIWEVVRAIKSARAAEPGLRDDDLLSLVSGNSGIALRVLSSAVRYWAAYPEEIRRKYPPPHHLFHVVNTTLNLVGGDNLAWQQRKAEPFSISS